LDYGKAVKHALARHPCLQEERESIPSTVCEVNPEHARIPPPDPDGIRTGGLLAVPVIR